MMETGKRAKSLSPVRAFCNNNVTIRFTYIACTVWYVFCTDYGISNKLYHVSSIEQPLLTCVRNLLCYVSRIARYARLHDTAAATSVITFDRGP